MGVVGRALPGRRARAPAIISMVTGTAIIPGGFTGALAVSEGEGSHGPISRRAWEKAREAFGQAERDGLRYPGRDPKLPNPSILDEVVIPADPGPDPGEPAEHCDCGCGVKVVLIGEGGSTRPKGQGDVYDCRESSWLKRGEDGGG